MKLITPLTIVSILVGDQDEALTFYTEKLGLEKRSDITFGPGLRLLTVAPRGQQRPELALAKPDIARHSAEQVQEVMGRVGRGIPWIFSTTDCRKTYEMLLARGVNFLSVPTKQIYGVEAIFADPYGNTFALLEATPEALTLFENRCIGTAA
jgi:catechol 2,3-dioxygenase-like lactoylglutathione lyase family enzyme